MALSITGGSGSVESQANTQTPQASVGPSGNTTSSGNVQPGTATSLLETDNGGIRLTNQMLPTVTVGATAIGTVQTTKPSAQTTKHHTNFFLLGLAIVIFVLAIGFFWTTFRSAKNTTE
jgi:hypothetical protein